MEIGNATRENLYSVSHCNFRYAYSVVQKHVPSGIIELKEIRSISDVLQDGTFQVCQRTR